MLVHWDLKDRKVLEVSLEKLDHLVKMEKTVHLVNEALKATVVTEAMLELEDLLVHRYIV